MDWLQVANIVYASTGNNIKEIKAISGDVIFDDVMPEVDNGKMEQAISMDFVDDKDEKHYKRCLMVVGNYLRGTVNRRKK
jgi:hypothetical protein